MIIHYLFLLISLDNAINLTRASHYDEALVFFNGIQNIDIERLPEFYFYKAICEHQLLIKNDCLSDLKSLDAIENIPKRYRVMSMLIQADLSTFKEDSLDEVSRLMTDAGRRLHLGRAGQVVRNEQQNIIDKLDKLIERAEQAEQAQKDAQSAQNARKTSRLERQAQNTQQPEDPQGNEMGPGNIDEKRYKTHSWGNLPPKKRYEAMQKLTEEFPSHYRDIIEGYFRELAK